MKSLRHLVLGIMMLMIALAVQAQDGTIEDVAANPANYYGQELTLSGTIENFLSPHVFVLGEDAAIDNDQVLVINRSGQVFPMNIMEGTYVTVTGTIYPSITERNNGATLDNFVIDSEVGNNNYYGTLDNMTMGSGGVILETTAEATDAASMGEVGTSSTGDIGGNNAGATTTGATGAEGATTADASSTGTTTSLDSTAMPSDPTGGTGSTNTDTSMGMLYDWGSFNLDTTSFYYNGWFADQYDNYTVMVVTSMNAVSLSTMPE